MDALGREHMRLDRLDQRHQRCRASAHPVGQRRDVELDPLARISLTQAMERQMQTVLAEQHMSEQERGASARDRMRGCRRLRDRLAGAARELLAHVLDHLPLPLHELPDGNPPAGMLGKTMCRNPSNLLADEKSDACIVPMSDLNKGGASKPAPMEGREGRRAAKRNA